MASTNSNVKNGSINTDDTKLQAIHYQRSNYTYWTKLPLAIDECERCGLRNYHGTLYKCYNCDIVHCLICVGIDPIFVIEYGDFIPIFCETECKDRYMKQEHAGLSDCDECHMMWPSDEYKKRCQKCLNGVCSKCTKRIDQGEFHHTHLDWEDPTC
jgi:hypothetical protein